MYPNGMQTLRILLLLVLSSTTLPRSLPARLVDSGRPYLVPEVSRANDYAHTIYVDPSADEHGDGSIDTPWNHASQLTQSDTAYLFKADTKWDSPGTLNVNAENTFLGRYGDGADPIIRTTGTTLTVNAKNVTITDLVLEKFGSGSYDAILGTGQENTTFARCRISGLDSGSGYPFYILKGGGPGLTFFECELSYSRNDGFYLSGKPNITFVSNYLHHQNMSNGSGDGIQMEYDGYHDFYFANNFVDRSHTSAKFGLILNGSLDGTHDTLAEWNTFVAPTGGSGGAAVRWLGGSRNRFNKNLIITGPDISGIATYDEHASQPEPYGIRDNHFYGEGNMFFGIGSWHESNIGFSDQASYLAYLAAHDIASYGSDLFSADKNSGPTPPSELQTSTLLNSIEITWTASTDNVAVASYTLYRDGEPVAIIRGDTKYLDSGLSPNTTYSYLVVANDATGNASTPSIAIQASTSTATDEIPPSQATELVGFAEWKTATLSWNPSTDNIAVAGYRVYQDGQLIADTAKSSIEIDNLTEGKNYQYSVVTYDFSGNESTPARLDLATKATGLPDNWDFAEIGQTGAKGFPLHDNGTFELNFDGNDIWNKSDSFGFVYTKLSGDGSISVRIKSVQNTNAWAKFGLMIRDSLEPDSANAALLSVPSGNAVFQSRDQNGADTSSDSAGTDSHPLWLRLTRIQGSVTSFYSTDGENWIESGATSIALDNNIYLGLALTSHSYGDLNQSVADSLTIDGFETWILPDTPSLLTIEHLGKAIRVSSPETGTLQKAPSPLGPWTVVTDTFQESHSFPEEEAVPAIFFRLLPE